MHLVGFYYEDKERMKEQCLSCSKYRLVFTKNLSESLIIQEKGIVCRLEEADEKMWVINTHSSGSSSKTNSLVKDTFEALMVAMIAQGFTVA